MSITTRYILREFLQIFLVTSAALALVEFLVDFLEKIRLLYQYSPEIVWLSQYFFFRLLGIFFETLPLALLLSTLITFGGLSKNNEITAFKSAGISVFRLAMPLLFFGAALSMLSFQLTGSLIPTLLKKSEWIRTVHIEKRNAPGGFVQGNTWLHLDSLRLIYVQMLSADKNRMQGVHLYVLDEDFVLKEETEASELVYEAGTWVLLAGTERRFLTDGRIQYRTFEREPIAINKSPEDFQEAAPVLKEMTHEDLKSYIARLSATGFDATRYEVDLRGKEALPFVNFMMVLLAVPFALKDQRSPGIAWGMALSLGIALSYWLVFSVTLALGRLAVLPPWLAGWSANMLILAVGITLFLNMRQ